MEGSRQIKTSTLIGLLVVLTIIAGLLLSLSNIAKQQRLLSIASFEECQAAGYPIMESYPAQCRTPDGRTFVQNVEPVQDPYPNTTSTMPAAQPIVANGCAIGGCSAQLCGEASEMENLVSTCEFRAEYQCYRGATCERQANGRCGWTETSELTQCLANPPQIEGGLEAI